MSATDKLSSRKQLADLTPEQLRALEWTACEPCLGTSGAWLSCPCCGTVKIVLAGHAPGCAIAAAIVTVCGREDATIEAGEGAEPWIVLFPDGGTEEFTGLGPRGTGEFGARLRQQQWRATVGRDLETGVLL